MSRMYLSGFTIIETMLFLGITGLLVMGILAGAGTSINIQRYRDSVTSLQSILQDQYSQVSNVANGRDSGWSCDNNAVISIGGTTIPGQSDCVILGRFITTPDGVNLSMSDVVGYISPVAPPATDDITTLKAYKLQTSPIDPTSYSLEWGASLTDPATKTASAFSMLIVRSPTSGVVRTFIDSTKVVASRNMGTMITAQALAENLEACVVAGGGLFVPKSAIHVVANATSSGGIQTIGEATSGC